MNRIFLLYSAPFLFALLLLTSCSEVENDNPKDRSASGISNTSLSDADIAWRALNEVTEQRSPLPTGGTEQTLVEYLRTQELLNQRRLWLGQEFWSDYPDDQRRYLWLIIATSLTPSYPKDIERWAEVVADPLSINSFELDRAVLEEWQTKYKFLREEFYSSDVVTEEQKRLLRSAEIKAQIELAYDALNRGEDIDPELILNNFLSFCSEFRRSRGPIDDSMYVATFRQLFRAITELYPEVFEWNSLSIKRFLEQVAQSDNAALSHRLPTKDDPDIFYPSIVETTNVEAIVSAAERSGFNNNLETADAERDVWLQMSAELTPKHIYHRAFSSTYEGLYITHYYLNRKNRLVREYGSYMWRNDKQASNSDKLRWLVATLENPPVYPENSLEFLHKSAINDPSGFPVDLSTISNSRFVIESFVEELKSTPIWSENVELAVHNARVRESFIIAGQLWRETRDRSYVDALLKAIEECFTIYGDARSTRVWANRVIRGRESFGLSVSDLDAFVLRLAAHKHPELAQPKKALESITESYSEPVQLDALTIHGDRFSLTEHRGDIILLDLWKTTCSACIAAMPRILGVSERYHQYGFVVVSVVFDGVANRKKVLRIKNELGVDWTTVVADDLYDDFSEKYGFVGFPQYLLLNRDGTLYAETNQVDLGRGLPMLLDEMIGKESTH